MSTERLRSSILIGVDIRQHILVRDLDWSDKPILDLSAIEAIDFARQLLAAAQTGIEGRK